MATNHGRAMIEAAMARARHGAGPAMAKNFLHGDWAMSVEEFEAFWRHRPLAALSTVSASGAPHVAAIEPALEDGVFRMQTFADAVRVADLRTRPQSSLISWRSAWEVVVVYGTASITEAAGAAMIDVTLTPRRNYAVRPPAWHHAANEHGAEERPSASSEP